MAVGRILRLLLYLRLVRNSEFDMMIRLALLAQFVHIQLFAGSTVEAGKAAMKKDVLNGYHLRASAYEFAPLFSITRKPGGNYSYEGMYYAVTEMIGKHFNMTLEYVNVDPEESKKYELTDVMKRQFQRSEVDFAAYVFEITFESLDYMALSYPTFIAKFTLLQPWPKEQSRLTAPIRPFTLGSWVWFLGSTFAFVALMSVLAAKVKYETGRTIMFRDAIRSESTWEMVYTQVEYVLTIITAQGNFVRYTTSAWIRAGIVFWLLSMIVLVNAYTGVLTAILTVPILEPTVKTLEELALTRRYRLTIEKKLLMAAQIMNSTEGYNTVFRDYFRKDPSLLTADPVRILDNVLNRDCAYAGPMEIANYYIKEDLKLQTKCRMTVPLQPLNHMVSYQNGYLKDFPFIDVIDQYFFIPAWDYGINRYFSNTYMPSSDKCRVDAPPESKIKVISVSDLSAPFMIYFMGLSLSAIAFVLENAYFYLIAQRKKKPKTSIVW